MKDFVKTMLAVICGLIVLRILAFFLMLIMFAGALAGGSSAPLPKEGVLDVDMSKFAIVEQTQDTPVPSFSLTGGMMTPEAQVGLLDAIKGLEAAAADPGVKYVLLRAEGATMGMSDAEEFRRALSEFRRSGKPVIAWLESPANGSYYISTVADKIYLSSYHGFSYQLIGLSARMTFVKDILDKLGVNVQLIRHGKYKSAGEMFIRNSASPENREQNQVMINSAWKVMTAAISEAREIPVDKFNALVDDLTLAQPEDFLAAGLVDALMTREELVEKLCTLAGVPSEDKLKLIPFADYALSKVKPALKSNVAIIYADGEITDGDDLTDIAGDRFVREINKVAKDNSIKAVVLRVNSPGGSVSASVKIRTALDSLQAHKPLVASFGNYAASGGYWISNGCEKIFADANTITGSIGVFSMIPEFSKVTKNVGVTFEAVNSNKHSDMYSLMRPFDKAELDYQQASVEDIYESFVNLVADGRKMAPSAVDAIAQGRVWMGSDAIEIGLVDEIGTLQDAIAYAATLAGIAVDDVRTAAFPAPLTFMEQLMESLGQGSSEPSILAGTPFEGLSTEVNAVLSAQPGKPMARLPYAYDIR
ncbi:MAG: signal peptide peptidase SppA [Bacteroidales bacterium]|nr:signal peptide peptidase SppA [Bacteroidales bacterium]